MQGNIPANISFCCVDIDGVSSVVTSKFSGRHVSLFPHYLKFFVKFVPFSLQFFIIEPYRLLRQDAWQLNTLL